MNGESIENRMMNTSETRKGGGMGGQVKRNTEFLFFHLCLSLSVSLPPLHWFLSVTVRLPLPAFRPLHINPSHQYLALHPPTMWYWLYVSPFSSSFNVSFKLSGLLLTPSSSTQPTHSVLWDELWLILSLLHSPSSLVTYPLSKSPFLHQLLSIVTIYL